MDCIFDIKELSCSYDRYSRDGSRRVVLEIAHLAIPRGKKVFIVGESGIGKSTVLETLGMMNNTIVPSEKSQFIYRGDDGQTVDLKSLWQKGDRQLAAFRLKHYSFIFQSTNLMKNFTAFENVAFTRMLQGFSRFSCFQRTRQVLADLGLEHVDELRMGQELSGGQQQRLAFARAILPDFTVLFGDEPTGNLDAENAQRVMEVLKQKLDEHDGSTAIIVSHDMHLAANFADVIIKIRKCLMPKKHDDDEDISYGFIDDNCVFSRTDDGMWAGVAKSYTPEEFEIFL